MTHENKPDYLYIKFSETYTLIEMKKYVVEAKEIITQTRAKKIFVDLYDLEQVFEKEFDRVLIIGFADKNLPKDIKISLYNSQSLINYMAVDTGLNLGFNINVFADKANALEWLLSDKK